jgi:tetratricopeptide (TPR) repeat protein
VRTRDWSPLGRTATAERWPGSSCRSGSRTGIPPSSDVALGYLQQAPGSESARTRVLRREALNNLGIVLCHLGRYGEAADHFRAAFDTHTRRGADKGRQVALNNIGDLEQMLGNYDVALDV